MKNAFHTVRALPLALALLMAGCSVPSLTRAPDSARPAVPANWSTDQAVSGADAAQAGWWQAFGDAQLSRWVELALARNNDVLTALARVEEARANLDVAGSAAADRKSVV